MPDAATPASTTARLRVLVTRPQPQAGEWVARLRAAGFDAWAFPLLDIAAPPPEAMPALAALWAAPPPWLVFVSPNAVHAAFGTRPAGAAWPAGCFAAAPGPGTAKALRDHGVPPAQVVQPAADAPQFDSESLWQQLQGRPWRGVDLAIVRGDGGREWLADRLREAGAQVHLVQAYRRAAPVLDATAQALLEGALHEPAAHLWLLSSSQALGHLAALAPPAAWAAQQALVSHPRIAEAARAVGFGRVDESRPAFYDVASALKAHAAAMQAGRGAAYNDSIPGPPPAPTAPPT